MDPADDDEEDWCARQRLNVADDLRSQGLKHGAIGEVPAWFVMPILSIWAIESLTSPGWVGWWAISGDLPTDYCSAKDCRHPRSAMRRFAETWSSAIARTRPQDESIGDLGLGVSLLPLLQDRAGLVFDLVANDDNWEDEPRPPA